jgi:hypothetical protein
MTLPTVWTVHITVKPSFPSGAGNDHDRAYLARARLGEITAEAFARTERGAIGLVLRNFGELLLAASLREP